MNHSASVCEVLQWIIGTLLVLDFLSAIFVSKLFHHHERTVRQWSDERAAKHGLANKYQELLLWLTEHDVRIPKHLAFHPNDSKAETNDGRR